MRCELCLGSGTGHVSMEGRADGARVLSRGATGQLAFPRARVWGEDPRGRRPGASPLGCSSHLFCLEAGMPGESGAQAQGRRDEKPPLKGRLQSALLPSPLFQTGPPPCCRCHEKQLGVTSREDHKLFLHVYPNVHRSTVYNSQDMEAT